LDFVASRDVEDDVEWVGLVWRIAKENGNGVMLGSDVAKGCTRGI
jgi:hypothetical protein